MNILITGGTGFIGAALCEALLQDGHSLILRTHRSAPGDSRVRCIQHCRELGPEDAIDAVINLAGEPIADRRWSAKQKQRIYQSRIRTTDEVVDFMTTAVYKPGVFISGSAIGYYGIAPSNDAIEETATGDDSFSSRLCAEWETHALRAESLGIRTILLRTGIVLDKHGGALKKMLLPFKFGLGGSIGNGQQWMPWIHRNDLVRIIQYCLRHEQMHGPVNGTAPNPVCNAAFTAALGRALKRPTLLTMPALVIQLLMGQMGRELLLSGKRVLPVKMQSAGFEFQFPELDAALEHIV